MAKAFTLKTHKLLCKISKILYLFDSVDNPADLISYKIRYMEFTEHKSELQSIIRDMLWIGEETTHREIEDRLNLIHDKIIKSVSKNNGSYLERNIQYWRTN